MKNVLTEEECAALRKRPARCPYVGEGCNTSKGCGECMKDRMLDTIAALRRAIKCCDAPYCHVRMNSNVFNPEISLPGELPCAECGQPVAQGKHYRDARHLCDGCTAPEPVSPDTRCPFHSRAQGYRCMGEAGHEGGCHNAGDGFASGYIPGATDPFTGKPK